MNRRTLFCLPLTLLAPVAAVKSNWMAETEMPEFEILMADARRMMEDQHAADLAKVQSSVNQSKWDLETELLERGWVITGEGKFDVS